jgi:hypothetical protein
MEPIANTDRLVMLLRQKLQERVKAVRTGRGGANQKEPRSSASEIGGLEAVAALAGVDDSHFRRAVIHSLLADQFGPDLINEAQFQQIVSRVTDMITGDEAASGLLDQVVAELRKA